jgi:hypothetical protein
MDTDTEKISSHAQPRGARFAAWFFLAWWLALASTTAMENPAHAQPATDRTAPEVILSSREVETGGTLFVLIDCRRLPAASRELRLTFHDQGIVVFPHPVKGPTVQAGLVGIPLAAPTGTAHLSIEWGSGSQRSTQKVAFEIRQGTYGEETLKVDPRHVRPSPKELERIRREQEELKRVYASGSRTRLWQGAFQIPVPGEMNGPFGTRRVFNGELQSHHTGADFRAQTGDPVHAAAAGVVRLTKDLFYSGNAVIIDHGAGVFTSYSHLSRIDVKTGQKVGKGQPVGLAGATGRATGPHLHWGVKVNSMNVNPLAFVRVTEFLGGG